MRKKLYADSSIKSTKKAIKNMKKKPVILICVSQRSKFAFEIINSVDIDFYKDYEIVGVAPTRRSANRLLCEIYKDSIENNIKVEDVKNYILEFIKIK